MKKLNLDLNFCEIRKRIEADMSGSKPVQWAKYVGVSSNIIANIHGKVQQPPSLQYIIAVARATGKPVEWYLYGLEAPKSGKCPTCGNWSNEVKEACRDLQEIMESGDEETQSTILGTLNVYRRSIEKKGKRTSKKDVPEMQPDTALPTGKRKQTAAR